MKRVLLAGHVKREGVVWTGVASHEGRVYYTVEGTRRKALSALFRSMETTEHTRRRMI